MTREQTRNAYDEKALFIPTVCLNAADLFIHPFCSKTDCSNY